MSPQTAVNDIQSPGAALSPVNSMSQVDIASEEPPKVVARL